MLLVLIQKRGKSKFSPHSNHSNHLSLSSEVMVGQRGLEPRTSVLSGLLP